MSLSLLARSPALRQHAVVRARALHATGPARSAHGDYHPLPFAWPGDKKRIFGLKVFAYFAVGFSIPFFTSWHQLKKGAGSSD
ncbi:hypothetical protein M413DRAFT_445787 [Hebeloma cylindrosporum]|uniref:Cytochrome c oxidase subunit 8, mitochondrial n=1 Tax=Hebeloma cylindrosporum TaxID=76867 RepID=A0A0C2XTP4_HEBCY|nr:hypothetical protein M413DRAFT_445787 [Hebeloma cylindrosporum h7]